MQAVVMAAGKSTRTYPLTLTRPKPLLPVMGKPILAHQIEALAGIAEEVVVIVGYRQEMIRDAFGDAYGTARIRYVEQKEQLGTGHAVLQCAGAIDGPFLVINGDDLYDPRDLGSLAQREQAALVREVKDPRLYGIYELTEGDRVVRLVEKPKEVFSHIANIGAYKFTPQVFEVLQDTPPSERGEIEITSAIQTLADDSDFRVTKQEGYWLPIGYPWHLIEANAQFLENFLPQRIIGKVHRAADVSGPVFVGRGTEIMSGAVVHGPVYIGENCHIGPNCWLRPGTSLGDGCRVGQASEIKNSVLMNGAAVPHLSYVGDSVIGEKSNLGAGTICANVRHDGANVKSEVKGALVDSGRRKLGAILGDGVHTGIHTSILPGRKLWPGTSTRPGAVVSRDITEPLA